MTRQTLLLVPGMLCDAQLWHASTSALNDVAECSVVDLHGHSIDDMAQHVLAAAPSRFALGGLSLGGYVALAILRQAPERVSRLCLANTSARPDTPAQSEARHALIAETEIGGFDRVLIRLLPLLTHPDRQSDADLQANIETMMRRVGPNAFMRQQRAAASRPDARPGLARVGIPACIIAGRFDRVTPPAHAVEMAGSITGARLHVLEDTAHLAPLEVPESVGAILHDWLTRA